MSSQALRPTPDQPASQEPKAAKRSQALDSNASNNQSPVSNRVDTQGTERDSVTHRNHQTAQNLTSEQASTLFPIENYGGYTAERLHNTNLANYREGKRLSGKFTAHLYDRVLPALNESIKRLKAGEEINGFSGERQVGAYLESVGYTAELVRQWNKRHRDRMAALKKVLGLGDGTSSAKLTSEQRELRDALKEQGYKNPEATRLAKAAEGNSPIERFNWVMAHRAREINGNTGTQKDVTGAISTATEVPNSAPATGTTEPPPAGESVTTVTHADGDPLVLRNTAADQLREALANEPDRNVASKLLTEHIQDYACQFTNDRITIKELKVSVEFAGRDHRIMPGDWLERRQGVPSTICKCVGIAEFMQRRRVQEWIEGKWAKEHVIFSQHEDDYRVITEESARRIAPEAFPTPTIPVRL